MEMYNENNVVDEQRKLFTETEFTLGENSVNVEMTIKS
jgi:hypothetical protein